jgi:hypothetical protein
VLDLEDNKYVKSGVMRITQAQINKTMVSCIVSAACLVMVYSALEDHA